MNKVILMGRLTKDVESHAIQSGTELAKFSLAVDRKYKKDGESDADFFNCDAWGNLAKFCINYLHKGTKVVVEGRLQNDSYTNREGKKITSTKVVCESIEFAESKKTESKAEEKSDFVNVTENIDLPF